MPATRTPRRRLAALGCALALVVGACSGDADDAGPTTTAAPDGADASTTSAPGAGDDEAGGATTTTAATAEPERFTGDDFYAVPDPLPAGDHGTLIRYEEVTPSTVDGATTYRVMYRSESLEGEPIAVTGIAVVPEAAAPEGGRPLLTIAHGTTGVADECAPSKEPGSELLLLGDVVADGWLVAYTDYEGLGTPGRHPYLVGESEGRSTIDAIVAAGQLPDADPGDRLAIAGYSQGGHGALWAGQVAAEWAPDLEVVGTFAGAPATEMGLIFAGAPAGFLVLTVAGYADAYPEADPATFLTPLGVEKLAAVDQGCTGDVFEAVSGVPKADLVQEGAAGREPWKALARENDPGRVAVDHPILVIHSEADATVPAALSAAMVDRMCGLGQQVERRVLTDGLDHGRAAPGAYVDGLAWLADRFEDVEVPASTCAGS